MYIWVTGGYLAELSLSPCGGWQDTPSHYRQGDDGRNGMLPSCQCEDKSISKHIILQVIGNAHLIWIPVTPSSVMNYRISYAIPSVLDPHLIACAIICLYGYMAAAVASIFVYCPCSGGVFSHPARPRASAPYAAHYWPVIRRFKGRLSLRRHTALGH